MEDFKNLKRVAMSELRKLDAQYANKEEFSESDAKMYNCLMHGLKSQLTAEAMIEAEEYEGGEGGMSGTRMTYSGRRGRGADGRYVSMGANKDYAEGYDRGYSEAMNHMGGGNTSGHYPPYYPVRW